MDPQDPSSWRRLPGHGEPSPEEVRTRSRDRGIRYVRRLSNWTAAALVAATAVTAGYFARASAGPARPAVVTGSQSQAANSRQPCVTAPVATSGGSGVATTAPAQSCAAETNGTRPAVVAVNPDDGRGD
jgi:hypothetical protein